MVKQTYNHFKVKLPALLLLLLTCLPAFTQEQKGSEPEKLRQLIRESDYVFEGKAVEGTKREYASDDGTKFYQSELIEVAKVFKGDLKPGTIELISSKLALSYEVKDGVRYGVSITHSDGINGVNVSYRTPSVFFARETNLLADPEKKAIAIDNLQKIDIETGNYGLLRFAPIGIKNHYGPYDTSFETEREVYDFLKSAGASIPDSVYNNALDYNLFRKMTEEPTSPEPEQKEKLTKEQKIQRNIRLYEIWIEIGKARGAFSKERKKKLKKHEKQLLKWRKKMGRYKKRNN